MLSAPTETYDRLWSPVLETLRADALDCVQANLAAVADRHNGSGAHLALGSALRFETEPGQDGAPQVASSVPYRLAAAHDLLGLRVAKRFDDVDGAALRELVGEHGPLYVIADAHTLAWTPYAGQQHTEHTFLLSASDTVVDAYHDETPWGSCRPSVWRLSPTDFDAMVPSATVLLLATEPVTARPGALADNARALADAVPDIDAYLAANRGSDQLVLDVWLLGRSRLLHAAWLGGNAEADAHAGAWLALASQTYVAWRRAKRTGALPATVLDELARLLHEDVAMAGRLAAAEPVAAADDDLVRATVLAAIEDVLRLDESIVLAARTLRDLPNFNSFRLVDIIERVESQLNVELDADDLTPQALRDTDSLCAAFARRSA
ncbi:acyl carrier protein [Solihabitans fulvus]|uniref:Acyl carrier protein n=1 Tax=Solihabitans fulvus TaxID=1892852 RepID=A0A5B2XEM2_9PSEU|nr:acyl carrier protein [Solihabitans fulvus]KAA2261400.1 acyl carrier protein [Solihabitans fulvus]